jgi:hypothetical protein
MNPFQAHAENMKAYEEMCAEPVNPEVQENTITIQSGTYTAIVGAFLRRDIFINGGVSPHLIGEVIVQKSVLPTGTKFSFGQKITAVPIGGPAHQCQVYGQDNTFTEWRLQLFDVNEGA